MNWIRCLLEMGSGTIVDNSFPNNLTHHRLDTKERNKSLSCCVAACWRLVAWEVPAHGFELISCWKGCVIPQELRKLHTHCCLLSFCCGWYLDLHVEHFPMLHSPHFALLILVSWLVGSSTISTLSLVAWSDLVWEYPVVLSSHGQLLLVCFLCEEWSELASS